MIDLLSLEPQRISRDLKGKYILLYGLPGVGKTSLASEFKNVLIAGFEMGTNALNNVYVQPIKTWKDWRDMVKQLCTKDALKDKFDSLGINLKKTVLILPEARSDELLKKEFWQILVKEIKSKGYTVIENIVNEQNHIDKCEHFDISLMELTAIAMNCYSVFSIRNGLCDIFAFLGRKLYVFWTRERFNCCGELFDFEALYDFTNLEKPSEILLEQGQPCKILFDTDDIGKNIPETALPPKLNLKKNERDFYYKLKIEGGSGYASLIRKQRRKETSQIRHQKRVNSIKHIIKGIIHRT